MKRMLSCLLCLVLTLGLCAGALAELNPPGSKPISNEKIHLTIGLAEEPTVLDYETNGMTLLLEEYGYDLDFVYYPSKEMATKIDLEMMAGGSVPQEDKDAFFQALMTAYVTAKNAASETFTPKSKHKAQDKADQ